MAKKKSKRATPSPARRRGPRKSARRRGGGPAAKTPQDGGSGLPEPGSDAFAYRVAVEAWQHGRTANAIVRALGLPSEPRYLMQVKRALRRAHKQFLRLFPPVHVGLEQELRARVNENKRRPIEFYVVDDTYGPPAEPVYAKAAEVVSRIIVEAARHAPRRTVAGQALDEDGPAASEPDIVICNAGGRSVSQVVKTLLRNPPLLADSEQEIARLTSRLLFVAGNAAYHPHQFHRSANFLSVTMAELFGARHLALPKVEDREFPDQHKKLVTNASLLICGAGSCVPSSHLGLMAQYFQNRGWSFPEDAVGDLAFNLLDCDGEEVELEEKEPREFMRQVNPTLDLTRIMHIATNHRVVLVLASPDPESKKQIGTAVLKRGYATDIVLGAKSARAILNAY